MPSRPNTAYFHVDNLGYGEIGCYGGARPHTERIDAFGEEAFLLLQYAPEAQCTPSRSALKTGRYAIPSGTGALASSDSGLVAWEREYDPWYDPKRDSVAYLMEAVRARRSDPRSGRPSTSR